MTNKWNNSDILAAYGAAVDDSRTGFVANVGVHCPVCETDSLDYERFTQIDMVVWCRRCKAGLKQGAGCDPRTIKHHQPQPMNPT